jgi:hypothetical protein
VIDRVHPVNVCLISSYKSISRLWRLVDSVKSTAGIHYPFLQIYLIPQFTIILSFSFRTPIPVAITADAESGLTFHLEASDALGTPLTAGHVLTAAQKLVAIFRIPFLHDGSGGQYQNTAFFL